MAVPDLRGSVFRRTDEVGRVGMEVDALDRSVVPLIDLDDVLGTEVVQFDLLVMRA